jgi:Predicted unsaturated glucuronyl hydrolase involved in regulation of bacterial surface properties, and related proteins
MKKLFSACLIILVIVLQTQCKDSKEEDVFNKEFIKKRMIEVADWQLRNPKHDVQDWTNGALYAGIYAAWETTKSEKLYSAMMDMGNCVKWTPYKRWFHADDIAICQTYIDLYRHEKRAEMIRPTIDTLNVLIATPYPTERPYQVIKWWWCDALFMGPPVFVKLGISTGNDTYLKTSDEYFKESYELLYNKEEKLFARDLRYVIKNDSTDRWEANGKRIFWSRGNGWVMGGLVKILQELPENYPERPFYQTLFKEMANKVLSLQQPDGLWRASLLDPESYPGGEVSGSAFFCYAFAWGINNKLLDKATYLAATKKCWIALNGSVNEEGRVGWVQPIGADPRKNFSEDSWEVYGTGAFLMAGSEIIKIKD